MSAPPKALSLLALFCLIFPYSTSTTVCIIGSGIGGSSLAHFLRRYSSHHPNNGTQILMFERNGVVGGRMATVTISGQSFEAGGAVLHPMNYHASNFTELVGLKRKTPSKAESFLSLGIWDGKAKKFVLKPKGVRSNSPFVQNIVSFANELHIFLRYGFSLLKMQNFLQNNVNMFLKYYESFKTRPIFETVDEMLKWAGLYSLTTQTFQEELVYAGLSPLLIKELVTVITRITYGQGVYLSGLAGAVALAGSGKGLWAVEGGNRLMASGLINSSNVELHLNEEIDSISYLGEYYELKSTKGKSYRCEVTAVATPLDELNIRFTPPISIPERKLQHTHATFVRGLLNPVYFGLRAVSEIPELVGTMEDPDLPFTCIAILKRQSETEIIYKLFSRNAMSDELLDTIFSVRKETVRINWGAYPQYKAPEVFAPIILDGRHLYYVNAFENAASTMEASAVAAENVARLILSRFFAEDFST